MAQWLKQSTAVTVKMGPFVDSSDGDTEETGLTISQADIRLSKNGGSFAQTNNSAGATHDENGIYGVPLDTTDTGTLGRLQVFIHESGALPVWMEFMVVPANVWDALFGGTDYLQVDAVQVEGSDATDQVNAACDTAIETYHLDHLLAATYDPASKPGASDALLNELVESDSGVARFTANALEEGPSGGGGSAPTAAEIADAVWDEATTSHTTAGTFGEQVKTDIDSVLTKVTTVEGYGAPPAATTVADAVLNRAVSNVEATADKHSLGAVIMITTNSSISGTTLTAMKPSDDSTFQTYTLTASASADPVTGIS